MIKLVPVLYFMDKKVDILILKFRTALIVLKFQVRKILSKDVSVVDDILVITEIIETNMDIYKLENEFRMIRQNKKLMVYHTILVKEEKELLKLIEKLSIK